MKIHFSRALPLDGICFDNGAKGVDSIIGVSDTRRISRFKALISPRSLLQLFENRLEWEPVARTLSVGNIAVADNTL